MKAGLCLAGVLILNTGIIQFFLYRVYNYLHIYHTEKWPEYTLNYPNAILRRNSGESSRGYGYTIELINTAGG